MAEIVDPPAPSSPAKKPLWKRWQGWLIGFLGLCIFCSCVSLLTGGDETGAETGAEAGAVAAVEEEPEQTEELPAATPEPSQTAEPTDTPAPTATPEPSNTPAPTETPEPTATATPVPPPLTFSGSGATVTEDFAPPGQFLVIEGTHSGSENFIVHLEDAQTAERATSWGINEIGGYTGEGVAILSEGTRETYFEVEADGPWSLTVKTLIHLEVLGAESSYSFSGTGAVVTPIFMLEEGRANFELSHDGEENFIVHLYSEQGRVGLANEIGAISARQLTERMGAGPHLIDIYADGAWTITVSQP